MTKTDTKKNKEIINVNENVSKNKKIITVIDRIFKILKEKKE